MKNIENNFFQILNSKEYTQPLSAEERIVLIHSLSELIEIEKQVCAQEVLVLQNLNFVATKKEETVSAKMHNTSSDCKMNGAIF